MHKLHRFWHNRICEAILFSGLFLVLPYLIAEFTPWQLDRVIGATPAAAAISGVLVVVAAAIARFWAPREHTEISTLILYAVTLGAWSIAVALSTMESPFIAVWALIISGAAIFGVPGFILALIAIGVVFDWKLIEGQSFEYLAPPMTLIALLPMIIGGILWRNRQAADGQGKDRAYHDLATELSQVSGKSDVVLNAITDGVLALNSKGQVELISPSAQQIIGWGKQDALSLDYRSVLKLTDGTGAPVSDATDPIREVISTNQTVSTDHLSLTTSSGKSTLISLVVSPIGQPGAGVIVVFRDITREKAEEREQAEFISTASHEMRTPVASIEGYLGLALNPATANIDDKARDFITKAHESAQHLGRLFQDLLDVSKAEDGRLTNNPKVVDVVPFIHDIAMGLKPKADEKSLRFLYKPIPDGSDDQKGPGARRISPVYYANVDNDHLREVVSNLIENAIKYTPSGDVTIDISGDDEHIVISVTDSGIGIPKEDQSHLFQKFYRVDNSDTREIGGTGLGLYLCRRLAETMEGRIWVDSEYKKGSTFYLEIPRISHEKATQMIEQAGLIAEAVATAPAIINDPVMPSAANKPTPPVTVAPQAAEPSISIQQPEVPPVIAPEATTEPQPQPQPRIIQTPEPQLPPSPSRSQINTPTRANTPISAIESNPSQYTRQSGNTISIPARQSGRWYEKT